MKIWHSYSGEHSSNMRIIGTFKSEDDANEAVAIFNAIIDRYNETEGQRFKTTFDRFRPIFEEHQFEKLTEGDMSELPYLYPIDKADGNQIVYDSDDEFLQILARVIMHKSGKIEIFSRHDYPS